MNEKNWRYLVVLKFSDDSEAVLGEYSYMFEAVNLVEEIERVIRIHGSLENIAEFKIMPFLEVEEKKQ